MEQTEYFRTLHEYIAHLDADLKVDDEVYEERLALCKSAKSCIRGCAGSAAATWSCGQ